MGITHRRVATAGLRVPVLLALLLAHAWPAVLAAEPPTPSQTPDLPPGQMTSAGGRAWKLASFPLRLATAASGLGLGALQGGAEGVMTLETHLAEETFGRAQRSPMLVPIGLAGAILALPLGIITGAPPQAAQGARDGWRWWDRY